GQFAANAPAPATALPAGGVDQLAFNGSAHGFAGSGGGGGGFVNSGTSLAAGMSPPVASAGIRSIRIELPQTGTPFMFTKVLNVHGEPLSIRARVTTMRTFQTMQMLW